MASRPPGASKLKPLEKLNRRHDRAAQLDAAGASRREIFAATGYGPTYISRLRTENPLYQQRKEYYRQNPHQPPPNDSAQPSPETNDREQLAGMLKENQARLTLLKAQLEAAEFETPRPETPPISSGGILSALLQSPSLRAQADNGTSGRPDWALPRHSPRSYLHFPRRRW